MLITIFFIFSLYAKILNLYTPIFEKPYETFCARLWTKTIFSCSFSFWTSLVSVGRIIPAAMLLIYYSMFSELILETLLEISSLVPVGNPSLAPDRYQLSGTK